jgi:hypothetical protein
MISMAISTGYATQKYLPDATIDLIAKEPGVIIAPVLLG